MIFKVMAWSRHTQWVEVSMHDANMNLLNLTGFDSRENAEETFENASFYTLQGLPENYNNAAKQNLNEFNVTIMEFL